jgi:16S rRNA (guanine527-N7)-methyltransferase
MEFEKRRSSSAPVAEPSADQMDAIFRSCGISLSKVQLRQLWAYHSLLRERNPDLNLTRIRNFDNMVLKLYVDSLLPAEMLDLPTPLLDLGTGPGMPGIPLKIYRPGLTVILAESRAHRVAFLQQAVDHLTLPGLSVFGGRISVRFEEPVAGVITRAVGSIEDILQRVQGCLMQGGRVICMKGPHSAPEADRVAERFAGAFALTEDRAYRIPGTAHVRRLLVYRRLDEPRFSVKAKAMTAHPPRTVASRQNPLFKELKKLLSSRGIRKQKQALVSGGKQIADALAGHPGRCLAWIGSGDRDPPPAESPRELKWFQLAPELFEELDTFGTHTPLLLLAVPEITAWRPAEGFPAGVSVLLPFQDPENVGAAIRAAAAFGAAQVICLAECAHPFHPKAWRASGGTALGVRLRQGPSVGELPPQLPILSLSADGRDLDAVSFPAAFGLLAGPEGPGLPEIWRRHAVRIPIAPRVESLNAATALAVALYEWRRREGGSKNMADGHTG